METNAEHPGCSPPGTEVVLDAVSEAIWLIVRNSTRLHGAQLSCHEVRRLLRAAVECAGEPHGANSPSGTVAPFTRKTCVLHQAQLGALSDNMAWYSGIIEAALAGCHMLFHMAWPELQHPLRLAVWEVPGALGQRGPGAGVALALDAAAEQGGVDLHTFIHARLHATTVPSLLCAEQQRMLLGSPLGSRAPSALVMYQICSQMLEGVASLHGMGVLHGDCQPHNITAAWSLVPASTGGAGAHGGSASPPPAAYVLSVRLRRLEIAQFMDPTTGCSAAEDRRGMPWYMRPWRRDQEQGVVTVYDDLAAVGLTFLEVCLGCAPGRCGLDEWLLDSAALAFLARGLEAVEAWEGELARGSEARLRAALAVRDTCGDAGRAWYGLLRCAACAIMAEQAALGARDIQAMMATHVRPHVQALRAARHGGGWVLLNAPPFLPAGVASRGAADGGGGGGALVAGCEVDSLALVLDKAVHDAVYREQLALLYRDVHARVAAHAQLTQQHGLGAAAAMSRQPSIGGGVVAAARGAGDAGGAAAGPSAPTRSLLQQQQSQGLGRVHSGVMGSSSDVTSVVSSVPSRQHHQHQHRRRTTHDVPGSSAGPCDMTSGGGRSAGQESAGSGDGGGCSGSMGGSPGSGGSSPGQQPFTTALTAGFTRVLNFAVSPPSPTAEEGGDGPMQSGGAWPAALEPSPTPPPLPPPLPRRQSLLSAQLRVQGAAPLPFTAGRAAVHPPTSQRWQQ